MTSPSSAELVATVFFGLAIAHTFLVKRFQSIAHRFPNGSAGENFFHLLGEVEVVFGFWAGIFLTWLAVSQGGEKAVHYLQERNFTEAAFVFVIMTICSTQPILKMATSIIESTSRILPVKRPLGFYFAALTIGPLLGSFITEPAAMTVTALILYDRYYTKGISSKLMYATLGLLFVNVSIGGVLTHFAAPPVLMVAPVWNWGLVHMLSHFGWKGALAALISTSLVAWRFRQELQGMEWSGDRKPSAERGIPLWIGLAHFIFLVLVVMTSHHMAVFIGLFMFFLGLVTVTQEYQQGLKIREGLLVAFFLGGLVVLGGMQRWWLEPILTRLSTLPLYVGAMSLTAFTDNAALTYLGSQVQGLSEYSKYALVAGSVVGGGLTVIANAPNPAGYGILNPAFGEDGISPMGLLQSALLPTMIAALCFWFL